MAEMQLNGSIYKNEQETAKCWKYKKKTVSKDGEKAKKRKRKRDKDNTPETNNRKIDTKEGEQVY